MPVAAHSSSSSPYSRAYATIAASTPSTCLRSDSDSVHSQKRRQASSRSTSLMRSTLLAATPVRRSKLLNLACIRRRRSIELPMHRQRSAAAGQQDAAAALLEVVRLHVLREVRQRPVDGCPLGHVRVPLEPRAVVGGTQGERHLPVGGRGVAHRDG